LIIKAGRWLLLAALATGIVLALVHRELLTVPELRRFVASLGPWGPIVFMVIYTIAPALFVPGLPLDLAAGLLFGPVWGTVYTMIGATAGATVAFLVARTIARDWVERRLPKRLARVKAGVDAEGWRFVALTRLIPIIPFNFLNYVLGLTKIGLVPYVAATFVFMLPATAAYVYAGWAAGEAAAGKGTLSGTIGRLLVALGALTALAMLPRLYRRWAASRRRVPL
jgi:uncharacterized membrane protein YdjX (TVP38/TMEM64 family)